MTVFDFTKKMKGIFRKLSYSCIPLYGQCQNVTVPPVFTSTLHTRALDLQIKVSSLKKIYTGT